MIRASKASGFTIVELLIVIVVIGLLAALVLNTFAGVQARGRDKERQTDVRAIAGALEAYHIDNGSYPRPGLLTPVDMAWVTANLPGFNTQALFGPNQTAISVIGSYEPVNVNRYGYTTYNSDGSSCTLVGGCARFDISWKSEVTSQFTHTKSLNQ